MPKAGYFFARPARRPGTLVRLRNIFVFDFPAACQASRKAGFILFTFFIIALLLQIHTEAAWRWHWPARHARSQHALTSPLITGSLGISFRRLPARAGTYFCSVNIGIDTSAACEPPIIAAAGRLRQPAGG